MAREADFYTAEEAAKVLGVPVRRVFGMLCGGELEGHQDEWARWLVPASAVQGARRSQVATPYPDGLSEQDAESRVALEDETSVRDAAETVVLGDGRPFLGPPSGAGSLSSEETTWETDEAPASSDPASPARADGSAVEAAETLPLDVRSEVVVSDAPPDETLEEITERLAAAVARTRELRESLELAEATEAELRERLERERRRIDRESAPAEQHETAERVEKEPANERNDGFWRGLFGG